TGTGNFQVVNGDDAAYGMADVLGLYRTEYGNEINGVRISRTQDYMLKVTDPDRNFAYLKANLGDRSSYFASQDTTSAVLTSGVDPDSGGEFVSGAGGIAGISFSLEEVQMENLGQSSFSVLASAGNLTLQIGPNEGWDHRMTITVDDMSVTGIGLTQELDISTQRAAMALIDTTMIDQSINRVSKQRGKLGALQNRLEHTIKNLSVTRENLQSSESRIRDADMAAEMMEFTKNQILLQTGTAMLAQANTISQSVLQLLQ
ncbi:MAG: flagellin, partial [bacterium]|nr:flagellin [bacterium]